MSENIDAQGQAISSARWLMEVAATIWGQANFSHSVIGAMRCDTCHNGQYLSYGASGTSAGHVIFPAGMDCGNCHRSTLSFATNVIYDHTGITAGCKTCHEAAFPLGHLPTPAGSDCSLCHRAPPTVPTWPQSNFTHAIIGTMRCDSCHNGQFTGYGANGLPGGHCAITTDCATCHTTSSWGNTIADCAATTTTTGGTTTGGTTTGGTTTGGTTTGGGGGGGMGGGGGGGGGGM